jgi:hypothetical protein
MNRVSRGRPLTAKFEELEDFGRVLKERFCSDSIRSRLGDERWILEMYKSDNDADLHTQSIAMHINAREPVDSLQERKVNVETPRITKTAMLTGKS